MKRWRFWNGFCLFLILLPGCIDQPSNPRELLSLAIEATSLQERPMYRGYAEVSMADQVIYREEAAVSDGRKIMNRLQEPETSPIANALFIPLKELEANAKDVRIDRKSNQFIVLSIDLDPQAAKQGIEQYFDARFQAIRDQYVLQRRQDEGRAEQLDHIFQQELQQLSSMLDTLSCNTRYMMTMDPRSYVIHQLDAESTLRYKMEDRTLQETVRGTFLMADQQ